MSLKKVAYWLGSLLGGVLGSGKTSLPISRTPEPEKVPDTSLSHTLEQDTWEGTFFDVVAQRSAKKSVQFDYIDASGSMTQRVVDIRAYEPQGGSGLVIGQCRLRNATRGLLVFSAISDGTKS